MILNKLKEIDPSKECLNFLYNRILADNYRGLQLSQHNRYTFEQAVGMLETLYELVGSSRMKIRTTDLSKRPHNTPDEAVYAKYTSLVNKKYGKSTQDSIRKNLFVDFHRMGLINRYNAKGQSLGAYENGAKHYVSISSLGIELIKAESLLIKRMIFSRCLDNLLKGMATDMLDVLGELDSISLDEYTFFISFTRQQLNGTIYSLDTLIEYVKEYRSLSRFQKNAVIQIVQDYCNPGSFAGDKTDKRDYHNWRNEGQQTFMLLGMTAYFEHDQRNEALHFMVRQGAVFSSQADIVKLKRSLLEKHQYLKEHDISKRLGFEFHHIVPLLWAKSAMQFFLLDKWQNMIYIDGYSHAKITQSGNKHIRLSFSDKDVLLYDTYDDEVNLTYDKNILYSLNKKQVMLETNTNLINSF